MTNSKAVDRRDVAAATNPIGGNNHIEDVEDAGLPPARSGKGADPALPVAPDGRSPGRLDPVRVDGRKTAHVQSPRPNN